MPNFDNETMLGIAFVALIGLALLAQAIVLLAIYLSLRKGIRSVREDLNEFRSTVAPVMADARDLFDKTRKVVDETQAFMTRVTPKAEAAVTDLAEMAHGLREQTAEVESAAQEIVERFRRQSERVDSMFSGLLDNIDRVGGLIAERVSRPVRQISGLLAGARAIVDTLRAPEPALRQRHSRNDKDMFI